MTLSVEQSNAAKGIKDWYSNSSDPLFTLHGYAGTGKTFLLQELASTFTGTLACCAPTGKAASVLKSKLDGIDVTTVHKLLYSPNSAGSGEYEILKKKLKENPDDFELSQQVEDMRRDLTSSKLSFEYNGGPDVAKDQLIIVDESSMATKAMRDDLVSTGAKILFVGDGGQLPPVGDDGWFTKATPNAVLEEVHRQALESPIIRLSMDVRNGSVDRAQYQSDLCRIVSKTEVTHQQWMDADQVITGMNRTRHKLNKWFRKKLEYEGQIPQKDERLICLKNAQRGPFINGVQMNCIGDAYVDDSGQWLISVEYDGQIYTDVPFYEYHCLKTYSDGEKEEPFFSRRGLLELDYAYAITCHKSQGSEWNNVIVADDKMMKQKKEFRKQWLYTAVTRAKEQLTWIQD